MTERYPEEMSDRIMGVIRDKAVADRVVRALIHVGFAPQDIIVVVSGVTELDFRAHEPGVQVVRYPVVAETGAFEHDVRATRPNVLLDWGISETDTTTWESRLRDGSVFIGVNCGTKCQLARSVFVDAGTEMVFTPSARAAAPEMAPPPGPMGPMGPNEPLPTDRGYMPPPNERGYVPPPEDRGYTPPPDVNARPPDGPSGIRLADNPYDDRWDFESNPEAKPTIESEKKTYGPPPPDVPPEDPSTRP